LHEHGDTALQKRNDRSENEKRNHERADGVDAIPAELPNENGGNDDTDTAEGISENVQEDAVKIIGMVVVAAIVTAMRMTTVRMTTVRMTAMRMVTVRVIVAVIVIALRMVLFLLLLETHEFQDVKIVERKDTNEIDDETEARDEEEAIGDDRGRTPNADGGVRKNAEGNEAKEDAIEVSGEDFHATEAVREGG